MSPMTATFPRQRGWTRNSFRKPTRNALPKDSLRCRHDSAEMHEKARFVKISSSGLRESHVHDVIITKEAPNYHVED